MTDHEIITSAVLGIIAILGFLMKRTVAEQDQKIVELQNNLHSVVNDLANTKQNYLHKDDFKDFKVELRGMFEEIRSDIRNLRGNQ